MRKNRRLEEVWEFNGKSFILCWMKCPFFYQDDPASISLASPVYEIVSSDESILEVSLTLQLFKDCSIECLLFANQVETHLCLCVLCFVHTCSILLDLVVRSFLFVCRVLSRKLRMLYVTIAELPRVENGQMESRTGQVSASHWRFEKRTLGL